MASEAFEDIADTFDFLDDWEDRYRHVIDIGKAMPPLEDAFRVAAAKVDGCDSRVWIWPQTAGGCHGPLFSFRGHSDVMIGGG